MKLIAHRGNINGPSKEENEPNFIKQALSAGFDVEVDLRVINGEYWLGHDEPTYKIKKLDIFPKENTWWHCKNFDALVALQGSDYNYFWHQEDDHTITSKGIIWTYPGKEISSTNVVVMPETAMNIKDITTIKAYAICSDYVGLF